MTEISYATVRPVSVTDVKPGDQVLSPYGYRVIKEAVQVSDTIVRFDLWDEASISRRVGTTIQAMRRLGAGEA